MPIEDSATTYLELESALDSRPLTLSADTPVAEVIATLGKAQSSCNLPGLELSLNTVLALQARAGAVWIVENETLLGQFTEVDALREIAAGRGDSTDPIQAVMKPVSMTYPLTPDADPFDTLETLRQNHLQQLPVVDARGKLLGVVTPERLRGMFHVDELLKHKTVGQTMQPCLPGARADQSIQILAQHLLNQPTDVLPLWDQQQGVSPPVGLLLTRDIIQLQRLGIDLSQIEARSIMQQPALVLPEGQSALVAQWTMQQRQVQRFLVDDGNGQIQGTVSPTSFLYTLDLGQMVEAHLEVARSVQHFVAHPPAIVNRQKQQDDDFDVLRQQLECSRLLSAMALHIRQSLDAGTILWTAVNEVRQFLNSDRVLIYQFAPDMSGTVVVESLAAGWTPALSSTVQDTCFGQYYAEAYKAGRTQVVDDIYTAGLSQCHIDILVLFDVRASLVVPIIQDNTLWGLLCAYHCSGPRHWRSFEVDLLNQLATHVAIAIQQSELYQQSQVEIQERQRIEQQLKASLNEKESLLKEIHHRVKNNLQIISSVLRLQSDFIKDETILSLFRDSQNRIRSMALIHEKLYKSQDLLRVHMEDYIHDLTAGLFPSYGSCPGNVDLQIKAEEVYLNIDTAIPCGLIIHELVSNSLKHAFPGPQADGNYVWVSLQPTGNDLQYLLTVSDNGIGFPENIDFRETDTLGLELVCVFTEQLEGSVDMVADGGTTFTVMFTEQSSPDEDS
jgi:two-component sensor histidine kinase/CBS domain-containing protein